MLNINIDLDGVLGNFCKRACNLFGIDHIDSHRNVNCVSQYIGVDKDYFWNQIDKAGHRFWEEIEPYPWFEDLISLVHRFDKNFFILTAPSKDSDSHKGKKLWIEKHFGKKFNRYVFCKAKYKYKLSFEPNSILIDDHLENIDDWNNNQNKHNISGCGIIFPQPWNGYFVQDKVSYVKDVIESYLGV